MALIEGLGDEVTVFFFLLLVCVLMSLAWLSTRVADLGPIRIVVLDHTRIQEFLRRFTNRNPRAQSQIDAGETAQEGAETRTPDSLPESSPAQNDGMDNSLPPSDVTGGLSAADSKIPSVSQTQTQSSAQSSNESDLPDMTSVEPTEISQSVLDSFLSSTRTPSSVCDEGSAESVQSANADCTGSDGRQDSNLDNKNLDSREPVQSGDVTSSADDSAGPDIPASPSSEAPPDETDQNQPLAEGHIRIRLKYLDERQKLVQARPEDTIAAFKRKHFAGEMADNFKVRFIHRGSELQEERSTLQANRIEDNSVIHCLLSRITQSEQPIHHQENFDLGFLMIPLFGLILGVMWYCRFTYRSYFSAMSTLSLMGISFLFLVAVLASFRRGVHEHED